MHFGLLALSIVGRDNRAAKTGLVGGAFALEQGRSLGQALGPTAFHLGRRIIGATPEGKKELLGLIDRVRRVRIV